MYGEEWLNGSNLKEITLREANFVEPRIQGFIASGTRRLPVLNEIVEAITSLILSIPGMREAIMSAIGVSSSSSSNPCCAKAAFQAEENVVTAIKEHMDAIAVPLYSILNLSERKYQDLIDYLGHKFDDGGDKTPFLLPLGNTIPRWVSKNKLLVEQHSFMQGLGLTMCPEKKTTYLSPKRLIIRRLKYLHRRGFIYIKDGSEQIV
jgi:hypothetical protein